MKTVLVIEDEKNIRDSIKDILEFNDYNVVVAKNGIEGVMAAKTHAIDLIICDVMMPELDGFGTLKSIRSSPETSAIPFIFLTAKVDKIDFREGMNLGADDFLTKPFHAMELINVISLRLEKKEKETQKFNSTVSVLKNDINQLQEKLNSLSYNNSHILRAPLLKVIGLIDYFTEELTENNSLKNNQTLKMLRESCDELQVATVEIERLLSKTGNL